MFSELDPSNTGFPDHWSVAFTSGDLIDSSGMKWVTFQKAQDRKIPSFENTVFPDGLIGVMRTGGIKPTMITEQGRNSDLIATNQRKEKKANHSRHRLNQNECFRDSSWFNMKTRRSTSSGVLKRLAVLRAIK
ncbi:hypothetical protein [Desulfatirhabdium butyrativorans]|uniref:hypothetical protein n=1 Tax=Desulfatirhabdium butyrativorans TaxID=340467 RepID=UPI003CCB80A1